MRFWIKCTRFGEEEACCVNFSLVGDMWRDGEKAILEFVGSNAQTVEVNETPDEISRSISVRLLSRVLQILGTGTGEVSVDLRTGNAHPDHWHALAWSREIRPKNAFAPRLASEPSTFA